MTASEKPYVPIADRPLLGVPEAAALCGLSEKAVYTAIKRGELLVCYVHSSTAHIRRRDLDLVSARTAAINEKHGLCTARSNRTKAVCIKSRYK